MASEGPPPLPSAVLVSAIKTYARAALYIFTAGFFMAFAHTFIAPKIEMFWAEAGQRSAPLAGMFSAVQFLKSNALFIVLGISVLIGVLEARATWWRRFRAIFVEIIVYGMFVATLAMYAAIAVAASVVAPLIGRGNSP